MRDNNKNVFKMIKKMKGGMIKKNSLHFLNLKTEDIFKVW